MDLLPYQFCNSIAGCTFNFETLPAFVRLDHEIAEASLVIPCLLLGIVPLVDATISTLFML
jgi:hypothetical protein